MLMNCIFNQINGDFHNYLSLYIGDNDNNTTCGPCCGPQVKQYALQKSCYCLINTIWYIQYVNSPKLRQLLIEMYRTPSCPANWTSIRIRRIAFNLNLLSLTKCFDEKWGHDIFSRVSHICGTFSIGHFSGAIFLATWLHACRMYWLNGCLEI